MRHLFSFSLAIAGLSLSLNMVECAQAQSTEISDIDELGAPTDIANSKQRESSTSSTDVADKVTSKLKVTRLPNKEPEQSTDLYLRQIQRIESQVNELKEEIFRSRTRLTILKESVLATGLSGTQVRIIHRNEMGASFKLVRALYKIDDEEIVRLGEKDDSKEEVVYDSTTFNENKQLSVEMVFRGHGFGVFSYLENFTFQVSETFVFKPENGKRLILTATAYERGGINVKTEDRPALRITADIEDLEETADKVKSARKKSSDKASTSAP